MYCIHEEDIIAWMKYNGLEFIQCACRFTENYTLNNIDVKWIYERTKILYSIAIDIIFKNMLGYEKYEFGRMI